MLGEIELLKRGLDSADTGIVVLGPRARPRLMTSSARRFLAAYCRPPARTGDRLPDVVRRWVIGQQAPGARAALHPRQPLVIERDGRRLVVRLMSEPGGDVLSIVEQRTTVRPALLERLGLTPREAEVLMWVAQGKTNSEIAGILSARPRTVAKHLERIYQKLGLETRTAAAALALRTLSDPHTPGE